MQSKNGEFSVTPLEPQTGGPSAFSLPLSILGPGLAVSAPYVPAATSLPLTATSYLFGDDSSEDSACTEDTMGNQFSDRNANIINNIAGKALTSNGRLRKTQDLERKLREAGALHLDMAHGNYHARRVLKLRMFIRRLFNPLGIELMSEDWSTMGVDASAPTSHFDLCVRRAGQVAKKLLEFKPVRFLFMLLVWYAMFGPDLAAMHGITAQHNTTLALVNTAVFFCFALELLLNCLATEGYQLSARFWVDVIATISIIGDTALGKEIITSDAVAGARVVRLLRMSRTARLPRMFSVFRKVQILRLIPKLMERFDTGRTDLALLLMKSRLQHVLLHLDEGATGYLTQNNAAYFHLAFSMEFGDGHVPPDAKDSLKLSGSLSPWISKLRMNAGSMESLSSVCPTNSALNNMMSATSTVQSQPLPSKGTTPGPTWSDVTRELMSGSVGPEALNYCLRDIQKLHEGTKAIGDLISRATLRVCMIVLFMLVVMSVLNSSAYDWTDLQGLALLHNAVDGFYGAAGPSGLNLTTVCEMARAYADRSVAGLRMLVLHKQIFWDVDGMPCGYQAAGISAYAEVPRIWNLRETLHEELDVAPMEVSNYATWCYPPDVNGAKYWECGVRSESFAMFDNKAQVRKDALQNMQMTIAAVSVLIFFVVFFSYHTKGIFDTVVLHPLWKFLDDMCAARCLEVIAEEPAEVGVPMTALMPDGWYTKCAKLSCWADSTLAASEELVRLDLCFQRLRGAMRSWAKYVPSELFNAIVDAGIESGLGVVRSEVTVVFVDVANIDDLAHDFTPDQMLVFLGSVLQIIVTVVEDLEGTVLEFIGDEVLAIFNAPSRVAHHTLKALMAAVEMQEVMRKRLRPRPHLSIGVHCDEVFVGNLGSSTRMKYGVIGDGVNMTARLKSLNTRFQTGIITTAEDLKGGVGDSFLCRPIGNLVLKGRKQASEVLEVLCKRSRRNPADLQQGSELNRQAFQSYLKRDFEEARQLAQQAHVHLSERLDGSSEGDLVTRHLQELCTRYIESPPGPEWDGSEKLQKKSW